MVGFVKPPVLPGVDEFVPDSLTELLSAELSVGVPGEPDRDRLSFWTVFGDAGLSLRSLGDLPVDRANGGLGKVFSSDVGCMRLRSVKQELSISSEKKLDSISGARS